MKEITLNAYAKINPYLEVTGKRPDGYHSIESVMHAISLADILTIRRTEDAVHMTCTDETLSCGEDNLVIRAARAFFAHTGITGGAEIHLRKHIPAQAGMGGGSTDAAATLRALNLLCDRPVSDEALLQLAASLGADVPFCLYGRPAFATGIGTALSPICALPPCLILVAIGKESKTSTPQAYAALDAKPYLPKDPTAFLAEWNRHDLSGICANLFNRFADVDPSVGKGAGLLRTLGAQGTLLCGSGAAFFGIFNPNAQAIAKNAAAELIKEGYQAWLCTPIG